MPTNAAITGWGSYSPAKVLTNDDLKALVDTTDEWIHSRTGIRERRIAGPQDTTATMCAEAGRRALRGAGLDARELDLIICASTTPDSLLPASACLVQRQLGAAAAGAFDLNAACTGFLCGLITGSQFIRSGAYQRVLVVAGEVLSRFTNWKDRGTCVLFGDGAAAVVLEATDQDCGVLSTMMGCQGDVDGLLTIEAGGSARPASAETVAAGGHLIGMRGNELFKVAVRSMAQASKQVLAAVNLTFRDLRKVIPHQANQRIIAATQHALGLTDEQVFLSLEHYGNTGAASVPMALAQFVEAERVEPGDHLLLVAFGGGLTWAAAVVRWADVTALREARTPRPEIRPGPPA